jgi:transposase
VGLNLTDRGRTGTKRHLVTDAAGLPLAVLITGANVYDCKLFEELLDSAVKGRRGRKRVRTGSTGLEEPAPHSRPRSCKTVRVQVPRPADRGGIRRVEVARA